MIAIAPQALGDVDAGAKDNFTRFVRREPLGVVFTVAAWNYPYLIAVNSVVPALMAGNAVVLKHSAQTPLCAERFAECLDAAGLPEGRVPGAACLARGHRSRHPRSARGLRRVHGLGRRRPRRAARGGAALHRRGSRARRLRSGVRAARRQPRARHREHRRRRVLQLRPVLLRPAAHLRASRASIRSSREGFVELTRKYALGDPTDAATTLGPAGAHRGRGRRARADRRRRSRPARTAPSTKASFAKSSAGHAVSRAAGAAGRRSPHDRHARGDLRPRGRHHEGELGRRGRGPHERQRLRPHRRDLDRRRRRRAGAGRSA